MAILTIIKYPDPLLSKLSTKVAKVDSEIARLMDDMAETMYSDNGVGLAAPQVGVLKRVIVIDTGKEGRLIQIANPAIISHQGEIEWEEGCLSIPEFRIKVKRFAKVAVRGLNKNNKEIEILAEGLLSVAFQHEIDHLDGNLLIDRVSKKERDKYLKLIKKTAIL